MTVSHCCCAVFPLSTPCPDLSINKTKQPSAISWACAIIPSKHKKWKNCNAFFCTLWLTNFKNVIRLQSITWYYKDLLDKIKLQNSSSSIIFLLRQQYLCLLMLPWFFLCLPLCISGGEKWKHTHKTAFAEAVHLPSWPPSLIHPACTIHPQQQPFPLAQSIAPLHLAQNLHTARQHDKHGIIFLIQKHRINHHIKLNNWCIITAYLFFFTCTVNRFFRQGLVFNIVFFPPSIIIAGKGWDKDGCRIFQKGLALSLPAALGAIVNL